MKLLSLLVLTLALCLSPLQAKPRPSQGEAKITKNEAEHIALKHHAGARVTAAKLGKIEGKLTWTIEITAPNARKITRVAVDAMSGKIIAQP